MTLDNCLFEAFFFLNYNRRIKIVPIWNCDNHSGHKISTLNMRIRPSSPRCSGYERLKGTGPSWKERRFTGSYSSTSHPHLVKNSAQNHPYSSHHGFFHRAHINIIRCVSVAYTWKTVPFYLYCVYGQEDPLEKRMATHSRILAWRIPWTEEQSTVYGVTNRRTRLSNQHFHFQLYATRLTAGTIF